MAKILLLGKNGQLGSHMVRVLRDEGHEVLATCRRQEDLCPQDGDLIFNVETYLDDVERHWFRPEHYEYVVNCIGSIKPRISYPDGISQNYVINSWFPTKLAEQCFNITKLIHITSDCVFSGKDGEYFESSYHDATDDYGRSKSLGEPINYCMVLRTSIIGSETANKYSLVEWAKSQKDNDVNGYTNHYWNGLTSNCLSQCVSELISAGFWTEGLFHLFSPSDVSKDQLLEMISDRFDLGLKINKVLGPEFCDRTLRSEERLVHNLTIPTLSKQIRDMP